MESRQIYCTVYSSRDSTIFYKKKVLSYSNLKKKEAAGRGALGPLLHVHVAIEECVVLLDLK